MGRPFIKFEGHTNILNPYARTRNNNIINPPTGKFQCKSRGHRYRRCVPGNYLFVDNFQLRLSDFKNMNRTDFIQLILNAKNYIEFLRNLKIVVLSENLLISGKIQVTKKNQYQQRKRKNLCSKVICK